MAIVNDPIEQDGICLNQQTVGNLKLYLNRFPDNARVFISGVGKSYDNYDCQIACNFEH